MTAPEHYIFCSRCLEAKNRSACDFGGLVWKRGICTSCGAQVEVVDPDLISHYKERGISDEDIWEFLPRLRRSINSWPEIEAHILRLPKRKATGPTCSMGYGRIARLEDTENIPE